MYSVITPGIFVTCPICKQLLSRSKAGVRAHLKMHTRKKELLKDEEVAMEKYIVGRREDT